MSQRKGLTLIELMLVMVLIGVLAAIAIPRFGNTKERAQLASMKADLRNLATVEETYLSEFGVYTPVTAGNPAGGPPSRDPVTGFLPSGNVTVAAVVVAGGTGWNATATHASAPGRVCEIFIAGGQVASPSGITTVEGEPSCD